MFHKLYNSYLILLSLPYFLLACGQGQESDQMLQFEQAANSQWGESLPADTTEMATAVFASGCFWCTEAVFERVAGVGEVLSGYAGGKQLKPNYKQVSAGQSDHAEAVIVYYDSTKVSYSTLLDIFFHSHDPTQLNRQGPDIGKQYRSGIYYQSRYQEELARQYMKSLERKREFSKPIVTEIKPLTKFWPAEDYHQDYYQQHPDDAYIRAVSMPKVKKFEKAYKHFLKPAYQ